MFRIINHPAQIQFDIPNTAQSPKNFQSTSIKIKQGHGHSLLHTQFSKYSDPVNLPHQVHSKMTSPVSNDFSQPLEPEAGKYTANLSMKIDQPIATLFCDSPSLNAKESHSEIFTNRLPHMGISIRNLSPNFSIP